MEDWNQNQIRWLAAYSDPAVGLEEFLTVQQEVAIDQRALVSKLSLYVADLPEEWRPVGDPIVEHVEGRLPYLDDLFRSVTSGSLEVEEAAWNAYVAFIIDDGPERITQAFTTPIFVECLRAEGIDPEELLDTFLRTIPTQP